MVVLIMSKKTMAVYLFFVPLLDVITLLGVDLGRLVTCMCLGLRMKGR